MKARLYWNYVTRSLRRGGQRTVLAVLCIAVGVMAIVALQLASQMVGNDLTSNVREANGGDVSIRNDVIPFQQSDVTYFAQLRKQGRVMAETGVTNDNGIASFKGRSYPVTVGAIDPAGYPLVGQPDFTQPANGNLHTILSGPNDVVISTNVATYIHAANGDILTLSGSAGRHLTLRVVGLVGGGGLSGNGISAYVRRSTYSAAAQTTATYNAFYMTTASDAQASSVAADLKQRYPLATVETVADALKSQEAQTAQVHQLLQVVGILALLIGGFGVVNTMNVMLARRRIEIAMLKTTGYRRSDLYALFGLEAAALGVMGGIVGAVVGVALSWVVKTLLENALLLRLPFTIDPGAVGMGIIVGLVTAVIFGLQPIVRAARTRPQAVLRDANDPVMPSSRVGTALLYVVLSVLFCILSSIILGSATWGIAVVYGTFIILGLLSGVFSLLVWLISKLPVPERFGGRQAMLSTIALLVSLAIAAMLPAIGGLLVVVALLGYVVAFLPNAWKATIKMSLRNIGRQRARSTMTLLALFVGVFSVGLMVVLGQDVRAKINDAIAGQTNYNVISSVPARWAGQVTGALPALPGLRKYTQINAAPTVPVAINGQSLVQIVLHSKTSTRRGLNTAAFLLSGLAGYDLAHHQATGVTIARGNGRDLTAADAGKSTVLVSALLRTLKPVQIKLGDRLTLTNQEHTTVVTVIVAGFYTENVASVSLPEPILGSRALVHGFAGADENEIYSLSIDAQKVDSAVEDLNRAAPHALTLSLVSLGSIVDQILGNLITLLVALAGLALFAGIIIIANAVGLAMLERRREQGILKAVGYTSGRVLAGVLVENGVVAGLGGLLGMVLVAIATTALARLYFKTSLDVPGLTTLALILLVTAIGLITSVLVAWRAVRVRPLDVLRYE